MDDFMEAERKNFEARKESERKNFEARECFIADAPYPEYAAFAGYCWDRGTSLLGYDDTARRKKAEELVVQLINESYNHDVATEDVTKILEYLYGNEETGVDVPECWELHLQQVEAEHRNEIQEGYASPLGLATKLGAQFISGHTGVPPALWGSSFDVLWSPGESLMIEAGYGAGKTTLGGLLIRAQLFGGDVLGYPVQRLPHDQKILYLAIDRPDQIGRSMSRQFNSGQLAEIAERLIIWRGPLPADAAEKSDLFVDLCNYHGAHFVYVDSLKDAARGLTEDRAAASYHLTRTRLLVTGRQLVELHHLAKSGTDYGSVWLRAGAGSVLRMSGKAGGPTGVLTHEKQPAHRVGPIKIAHDRDRGEIDVAQADAPVALVDWIADQPDGVTAADAAQLLYGSAGNTERKRASRKLTDLKEAGEVRSVDGEGRNPTRWYAEN